MNERSEPARSSKTDVSGSDTAIAHQSAALPARERVYALGTLGETLIQQGSKKSQQTAFSFFTYRDNETPDIAAVTFAELAQTSKAVAAALQSRCREGDRVLILCAPGLEYIHAFFGCQLAGMVAVPAYPPGNARNIARLQAIVDDADAAIVITTSKLAEKMASMSLGGRSFPPLLFVDTIDRDRAADWRKPVQSSDDLAFLQYTSGTTGTPKGVMVDHKTLMANALATISLRGLGEDEVGVFWLPPYHDMGLVGALIIPVVLGRWSILMTPAAFLQRPVRWLEAISSFKATITAAPNFAWQLCCGIDDCALSSLDLSSLRHALSGAETVRPQTLEAFSAHFERCGFDKRCFAPVYGMAETVALSSGCPAPASPKTHVFDRAALVRDDQVAAPSLAIAPLTKTGHFEATSCGPALAGHEMAIVDPTSREQLAENRVGEIWLKGPSVAAGYWNRDEETAKIFHAQIAHQPDAGSWLRTGDFGTIHEGEIYILGRLKDAIIVRGRNHYAEDLEATAQAANRVLGHDRTVAFGVAAEGSEAVVIAHELTRSSMKVAEPEQLAMNIRRAVFATHGIGVAEVMFLRPARLPRTTSGKLQRSEIREAYENGALDPIVVARVRDIDPAAFVSQSENVADQIISRLRELAETELHSRAMDEAREIPASVTKALATAGLFGLEIPPELGGVGLTHRDLARVTEQLAAIDTTLAVYVWGVASLASRPLLKSASPELRKSILPEVASGKALLSFALTEPAAGSNPRAIQTLAVPDGAGRWKINGEKWWGGSASYARWITVFCTMVDESGRSLGPAAFVIDGNAEGVVHGEAALSMGMRAMTQSTVRLEDVVVGEDRLLGRPGEGLAIAIDAMSHGRLVLAMGAVGGIKRCLQLMHRYAERRLVGTGRLLDNPVTGERIGELFAKADGLQALVEHVADRLDGAQDVPADLYAVLKLCLEFHWQAADVLVQLLGARGYDERNLAAQILRDARVGRIGEGPSETHAMFLGLRLLHGTSELTDHIRDALLDETGSTWLTAFVERLRAVGVDAAAPAHGAHAMRLGEVATLATFASALTRHGPLDDADRERSLGELKRILNATAEATESALAREVAPSQYLSARVASLSKAIGDLEQQGGVELDPYLRRDPDAFLSLQHNAVPETVVVHGSDESEAATPASLSLVREILADVTKIPLENIRAESDLMALGIDSLQAVQFVGRVASATGRELDLSAFFDAATVGGLARFLDEADHLDAATIRVADKSLATPLTHQQRRFWALEKRDAFRGAFTDVTVIDLWGEVDLDALEKALQDLVDRHDALRLRVELHGDEPYQVYRPPFPIDLGREDICNASDKEKAERIGELKTQVLNVAKRLFRFDALRFAPDHVVLVLAVHHLATDASTWAVLLSDLEALYNAAVENAPDPLPSPARQYGDYAAWQSHQLAAGAFGDDIAYWQSVLSDRVPALLLPSRRTAPVGAGFGVASIEVDVPVATVGFLKILAAKEQVTLFAVLETALAITLYAASGSAEQMIATNPAARPSAQFEATAGLFGVSLPIRHRFDPSQSLSQVLQQSRAAIVGALDHVNVPFDVIAGAIQKRRTEEEAAFAPLQVQFVLHGAFRRGRPDEIALEGLKTRIQPRPRRAMRGDLTMDLFEQPDGSLSGTLEYPEHHHHRAGVEKIAAQFCTLLEAFGRALNPSIQSLVQEIDAETSGPSERQLSERSLDQAPRGPKNLSADPILSRTTFIIPFADRSRPLPASYQQERLWFLSQFDETAGAAYHMERVVRLTGRLNVDALHRAFQAVVARHDTLRTTFAQSGDGRPVLSVQPPAETTSVLTVEHVSARSAASLAERVEVLFAEPFDFEAGPLFRARLLRKSAEEHVLIVGGHHAVLDGWSVGLLLRDLSAFYREAVGGAEADIAPLPVTHADYASWQRTSLSVDRLQSEIAWWAAQLEGVPDATALPTDRPRPTAMDYRGDSVPLTIPADVTAALKALAEGEGATLFMLLQAGLAALLSRLGAGESIVLGTAVAGRPRPELEQIAGFFVNTVALRHRVDPLASFREQVASAKTVVLSAFEHDVAPFDHVVDAVTPKRSLSHPPLVQVMLVLQNTPDDVATLQLEGVSASEFEAAGGTAKFELSLEFRESASGLVGALTFATQVFDRETAARLADMFARLLAHAARAPHTPIADLALIGAGERQQLISAFNDTAAPIPQDRTILDLFAEQLEKSPAAVAIVDEDRALSYADLDKASNRLARHLIALGVGPEQVVGVCLERSADLVVSLFAILKAGAGYLPLDPEHPRDRLAFLLEDAGASVVLTTANTLFGSLNDLGGAVVVRVNDEQAAAFIERLSEAPVRDHDRLGTLTAENLAYVIYTSGSTGQPKGVMVGHGELMNRLAWMQSNTRLSPDDVILQKTPSTFDVSVWEFFWWAIAGARVAILAPGKHREPAAVAEAIERYGVTTVHFVPSMFEAFLTHTEQQGGWFDRQSICRCFTSGEALTTRMVTAFHAQTRGRIQLTNLYGPTEATVDVTAHTPDPGAPSVPIGGPVANTEVYVVDDRLEPVPVGGIGELLIGGVQVSRGYLGRSPLTAERFVADPFSGRRGARLYRTGDLARWRNDGTLEFLGRIDDQVKVRGMRVEPGEIEAALTTCEGIAQAAVVARRGASGETSLIAHIVPSTVPEDVLTAAGSVPHDGLTETERCGVHILADGAVDLSAVREALQRALPEHMVPSGFVVLSRLPMTASGKIDRKALPDSDAAVARARYTAPKGETETLVAATIAELLEVEKVGREDDFFALGGHSLTAVRLAARLQADTRKMVTVRAIFETPTVARLAATIDESVSDKAAGPIAVVDRSSPIAPSFQQERLYFLDRLDPRASAAYHLEAAARLTGALDVGALEAAISQLVERHESLRTTFTTTEDGQPVLTVRPAVGVGFSLAVDDAVGLSPDELAERVRECLDKPFDFAEGPLFRARLLKLSTDEHVLVAGGHHAVLDGWSVGLLMKEAAALYRELTAGERADLAELSVQYADYAAWQRSNLSNERLNEGIAWWRQALSGAPEVIDLPFDRPRPVVADYAGGAVPILVPSDLVAALKQLATEEGATLFMVLSAFFSAFLMRVGAGNDVIIGTAVAGRARPELEGLAGYFVNTVALRHPVEGLASFHDHLSATKAIVLDAIAHQDVPFDRVVRAVSPARTMSYAPIAQVVFVLQNAPDGSDGLDLVGIEASPFEGRTNTAQWDLLLDLKETPNGLEGSLSFATQLFDWQTAERLTQMFVRGLRDAAMSPAKKLLDLALIDAAERERVMMGFNPSPTVPTSDDTLIHRVAAQALARPDAIAISDGDTTLTYGELDAESSRLARHLMGLGAGPETAVAVRLERSSRLVMALLAIWKAGAAYVPLDAENPIDRQNFILADTNAVLVVTGGGEARADHACTPIVDLDEPGTAAAIAGLPAQSVSDGERLAPLASANLAYIIYTSGSTGTPKGSLVSHENVARLMSQTEPTFRFGPTDSWTLFHSISFDFSVWEIWGALSTGGRLVIVDQRTAKSPDAFLALLGREEITVLNQTPTAFSGLMHSALRDGARLPSLQTVIFGGERLEMRDLAPWFERYGHDKPQLVNMYGITETTVHVTCLPITAETALGGSSEIGAAIPDLKIYVLDERLEPQPIGVAGEIYVGGAGLSRGYLGRASLTAEKFVADPLSGEAGSRLYRTGDLARWREDGTLQFLGRIDDQAKIRGMRVEPGEIEAALATCAGVSHAAVVARQDCDGAARLLAYLVPEAGRIDAVDLASVRARLKETLPEHMVPSGYVLTPVLPLNASGKLDRHALPDADVEVAKAPYAAPEGTSETVVAAAFSELLGVDGVGRDDGFFDLGGHSLMAVRLIARLAAETGKTLPLRTVFDASTVAELGAALDVAKPDWAAVPLVEADRSEPLLASHQQERLWFLDRLDQAAGAAYHIEFAMRLEGELNRLALEEALNAVVARHESLRTTFNATADGRPLLRVRPADSTGFALEEEDATHLPGDAVSQRVAALLRRPFNLEAGPLFRARLLKISPSAHILVIGGHHTVLDGWSVWLLLKELSALYRQGVTGEPANLPELAIGYADYAAWQRTVLSRERLQKETAWWQSELAGIPEAIALPTDRPRPAVMSYRGGSIRVRVSAAVTRRLKDVVASQGATLFIGLHAAYSALLSRLGAGDDVVVGSAVAGRPRVEFEPHVGFFVNTIALRHTVDIATSFSGHLKTVKDTVLSAFAHQAVPFERVVEAVSPARPLSHPPVVQTTLTLQNTPDAATTVTFPSVEASVFGDVAQMAPWELSLSLTDTADGLDGSLTYAAQLFDRETAERIAKMFVTFLTAAVEAPEQTLADLPLMDAAARARAEAFNNTEQSYPRQKTVLDLIDLQVTAQPDALAVADGERRLSYAALEAAANRLARHLIDLGVGPEEAVGVSLVHSVDLIIALLAIWKAGGAYLPLDPTYPEERLKFMLADTGAGVVLTSQALADEKPALGVDTRLVLLDHPGTDTSLADYSSSPVRRDEHAVALDPKRLAYVIYTSGSTGEPKGVMVSHAELTAFVSWAGSTPATDHKPRMLMRTPIGFDSTFRELLLPITLGGSLHAINAEVLRTDVAQIEQLGIDSINAVPGFTEAVLAECRPSWLEGLRYLYCGGDVLTPPVRERTAALMKNARLVHGYGPTEATGNMTAESFTDSIGKPGISIGAPVWNTRVHILDGRLAPCPIGVAGELFVGGAQVSRGYLGRPGLTAERFIADPFSGEPGARLYRTGDLARWRANGTIEFLGRADAQVKLRGMRVEPGEIEAALMRLDDVLQAAVVPRQSEDGDTRLVAYIARSSAAPDKTSSAVVDDWQRVFNQSYSALSDDPDDFDFSTWVSSYTGEPYPREAMLEWRQETLDKLMRLPHKRVLEVGCGIGVILAGLAPYAERYVGTDVSAAAIAMCARRRAARQDLRHVELHTVPAGEDVARVEGTFDLIFLNSVVQYFPNAQHLERVLSGLTEKLAPGGCLFVGDVRDFRTLEHFYADIATKPGAVARKNRVLRSVSRENELVLHPAWFEDFARKDPNLDTALLSPRFEKQVTEMSMFRYDAFLRHSNGERGHSAVEWVESVPENTGQLKTIVTTNSDIAVGVERVRDKRLARALGNHQMVFGRTLGSVWRTDDAQRGLDLSEHFDLAADLGRTLSVRLTAEPGIVSVIYLKQDEMDDAGNYEETPLPVSAKLSNDPSLVLTADPGAIASIRTDLSRTLPDHMIPSGYVFLSRLPRTSSGKVDRKALDDADAAVAQTPYAAPETDTERLIAQKFEALLGVERVGRDDNFFDLGGHSLFVVRLTAHLAAETGKSLPLRTVFEDPTVAGLASALDGMKPDWTTKPITLVDRSGTLRPSYQQERLWFLDRLDQGAGAAYQIEGAIRLVGALDVGALRASLRRVVARHESLRTRFGTDESGQPILLVGPAESSTLAIEDEELTGQPEDAVCDRVRTLLARPFDLEVGPLFRAHFLKVGHDEHILVVGGHHTVLDGWSVGILLKDVSAYYREAVTSQPTSLPHLLVQYADYAAWQRHVLSGEELETETAWWLDRLEGIPEAINLPFDRPRPTAMDYRGRTVPMNIPAGVATALASLAESEGGTLFMALSAALSALLSRLGAGSDVVIGTAVAGRARPEFEPLAGFFVNTVALRSSVDPLTSFREHFLATKSDVLDAFAHQDVPFDRVVEALAPVRSLSWPPLVQVMLVLQNTPDREMALSLPGIDATPVVGEDGTAQFELSLVLSETPEGLVGTLTYAAQLFDQPTAVRFCHMFSRLLAQAVTSPQVPLADLPLINETERKLVLAGFNDTARDDHLSKTLMEFVDAQTALRPGTPAVIDATRELTYQDLADESDRLAERLIELNAGPEKVVAVCLPRAAEVPVSILAIWKAGAAYLPLEPDHPAERRAMMVEDASASVVITTSAFAEAFRASGGLGAPAVIALDTPQTELAAASSTPALTTRRPAPEQLAYIIYTSGSTGRPKGVAMSHGSVANRLVWMREAMGAGPQDRVLHKTTVTFDDSLCELFLGLISGGTLVIAAAGNQADAPYLAELIERERISITHFVPAMLDAFLVSARADQCRSMRHTIASGEALNAGTASTTLNLLPGALWNLYGPTEAAIDATAWVCRDDPSGAPPPIGKPIANMRAYVLDDRLKPAPVGVIGELWLAGVGLARGYHGRPDLTAERFMACPFGLPGERMYRTGDLARFRPDGVLEFFQRNDAQIQIRGMRVEPGEIEAVLLTLDGIAQASVVAHRNGGDIRLIAYVVPTSVSDEVRAIALGIERDALTDDHRAAIQVLGAEAGLELQLIRDELKRRLPDYMVPAGYVILSRLPLTTAGKVDRKSLPAADAVVAQATYTAPEGPAETLVASVFAELLGLTGVGRDDGFFDLGGHSLMAARLLARLEAERGKALPLRTVFEAPTVASLAAMLDDAAAEWSSAPIVPVGRDGPLPASHQQEQLWFLSRLDPSASAAYHIESALRLVGPLNVVALESALATIVERHESLRTTFADGRDGQPVLVIKPKSASGFALDRQDMSDCSEAEVSVHVGSLLAEPFDLAEGPLFRARLLKLSAEEHVLVVGGHHAVLDGWSVSLLLKELSALYAQAVTAEPARLPELTVQYADYAAWHRKVLSPEKLEAEAAWWRSTLSGIPEAITLPTDRPRPQRRDFAGSTVPISVSPDVTAKLNALARKERATLFMVLSAGLSTLLSRLGAGEDVVIGTVVAGRPQPVLEPLAGFFLNALALRHSVDDLSPFREHLGATKAIVLQATAHHWLPFDKVVEAVSPARSLSHPPVVQIMLILQNTPDLIAPTLTGIEASPFRTGGGAAQFELSFMLTETADGLKGHLTYATQLFDKATAERLAGMFVALLGAVANTPDALLGDLPLVGEGERKRLTQTSRGSVADAGEYTITDLISARAAVQPTAVAVRDGDRTLTYQELDSASNRAARQLIKLGVGPTSVVAVSLEHSAELVVARLAIWKAGGTYLPLDPNDPADRLALIAAEADASVVITSASLNQRVRLPTLTIALDPPTGSFDTSEEAIRADELLDRVSPDTPAVVLFTSGSMAGPKGVVLPYAALTANAAAHGKEYGIDARSRVLLQAAVGWVTSLDEMLAALVNGGSIVVSTSDRADPAGLWRAMSGEDVSHIICVPQLVGFAEEPLALRDANVIVAGSRPRMSDIAAVCEVAHLKNNYGATEFASVLFSGKVKNEDDLFRFHPLPDAAIYVVDPRLELCPAGVPGELLVSGALMALGYINRPGLTASTFIADPFSGDPGARLYRTGDIARWRTDGTLELMGRLGNQLKIRGMRVEPDEVEAALMEHGGIDAAVVIGVPGPDGDTRLAAYVVSCEAADHVDLEAVRLALRQTLPEHMVPAAYAVLSKVPRTPSGKVDRQALPAVELQVVRTRYVAPVGELETLVAETVGRVLGIERVGRNDTFFDLGGHSLLAARLVAELEAQTGRALPLRSVFEAPTVAGLAQAVGEEAPLQPDEDDIRMLRQDPSLAADFDALFGKGTADRVLKGGGPQ
ncbi:MAG: non-ribosomal peptide synthase/polyketide synthase [Devosia sp.]